MYIIYIHIIWFIYTNIYIYICINHSEGAVSPRPSSPRWIWMERPTWRLEICKVSVLFFMVDMKKRCAIKRSGCICLQRMAGTKFCKLAVGALWHAGGQGLKMMSSDCACERHRCDHLPHFELMEHAPGWTWCSSWEAYDRAQQLDGWPFPAELELLERLELRWGQCQGKGPGKCLRLEFHILEIHGSAPVWRKNGDVFSQLIWRRTDSICNLLALFLAQAISRAGVFACLCQQNLLLLGLDVFAPRRTPDPLMTHSFASLQWWTLVEMKLRILRRRMHPYSLHIHERLLPQGIWIKKCLSCLHHLHHLMISYENLMSLMYTYVSLILVRQILRSHWAFSICSTLRFCWKKQCWAAWRMGSSN